MTVRGKTIEVEPFPAFAAVLMLAACSSSDSSNASGAAGAGAGGAGGADRIDLQRVGMARNAGQRDALPREVNTAVNLAEFHEQVNDALG